MEKIDKDLDEFLDRASQNFTKLEKLHEVRSGNKQNTFQRNFELRRQIKYPVSDLETLAAGWEEQIVRERVRLEREIQKMADKASHAVENW